jgi:PIN domain nuclease of toxin-antitoxin system
MKLLLDTNALIWWLIDDPSLGRRARARIADPRNQIMTSIVCLWEISIKWRVHKFDQPGTYFSGLIEEQGIGLLGVSPAHLAALEDLPFYHGDPYDHMVLAQARVEGASIMTSDRRMTDYGVPCVGVA